MGEPVRPLLWLGADTVYLWSPRTTVYRPRHWLSRRERRVLVQRGDRLLTFHWLPFLAGLYLVAESHVSAPRTPYLTYPRREKALSMKKREKLGLVGIPPVPASAASTMLPKLPLIREWLSATVYDDRTARTPGALRITTRDAVWHLTLTDPDAMARLPVSDASLDKALLILEQYLGAEDAPWQPDPYAKPTGGRKKSG